MITIIVIIITIIRWPPLPISWLLRLARGFTSISSWLLHLYLYSHHIVPRCLPVLTRTSSSQSLSRGNPENRCQQFRTNHERSVKWHLVHRALLHTVSGLFVGCSMQLQSTKCCIDNVVMIERDSCDIVLLDLSEALLLWWRIIT